MVWSPVQRDRLAIEKETLEQYFRLGVTWIDPQGETKVEVLLKSNGDREYILRVYIPADFPNSCPALVVASPQKLLLKNGMRLPQVSDSFHTLEDTHGFHRICHFYPPDWTPDITLYQVFMKGRLWIEAYEAHLETGEDMDVYLGEQKFAVDSEESDQYFDDPTFLGAERCSGRVPEPYMPASFPYPSDHTLPSLLPFNSARYQPPERRVSNEAMLYSTEQIISNNNTTTINNNCNSANTNTNNDNRDAPTLSFPPYLGRGEQRNQNEALRGSDEISYVADQPPDNQNNVKQLQTEPPTNRAPPQRYRPAGAVNVMLPFNEEITRRRNSSSRSHATVVPPAVKPKPRRQAR